MAGDAGVPCRGHPPRGTGRLSSAADVEPTCAVHRQTCDSTPPGSAGASSLAPSAALPTWVNRTSGAWASRASLRRPLPRWVGGCTHACMHAGLEDGRWLLSLPRALHSWKGPLPGFLATAPQLCHNCTATVPQLCQNMELVERMRAVAQRKGATASQLALAWVLAQGPDVVPIPGAKAGGLCGCGP